MASSEKGSVKEPVLNMSGYGYTISWEGGGEVPELLSGYFTSPVEANKAIAEYLRTRRTPKNAKTTDRTK
jgi:hypothetical protein